MTTMIAEVYDALIEAGASEEKARKAAEAIASYDDRFNRIDVALAEIRGSIRLLQWQVGAIALIGVPSLWLLLRIAAKVGALG
jgi:hypothetical protein